MQLHEYLDMIGCKVLIESTTSGKFMGKIPDMVVENMRGYCEIQAYGDTIDEIVQGLIDKLKEEEIISVVVNQHDGYGYKTKYKIPVKLELKAEGKIMPQVDIDKVINEIKAHFNIDDERVQHLINDINMLASTTPESLKDKPERVVCPTCKGTGQYYHGFTIYSCIDYRL